MTERQPGREGPRNAQKPQIKPGVPGRDPSSGGGSGPVPDEEVLFRTDTDRRIFGEGSYAEGGSNQEGNYKKREASPHGSEGSFDDAGGYGGTELLGQYTAEEAARRAREASEERSGPNETVDDS